MDAEKPADQGGLGEDLRSMIRAVLEEYTDRERQKSEPTYKLELVEERKRREQLERRVNELAAENARRRKEADEADRASRIRGELQKLGVSKVDLAFRILKDDIIRTEDGSLFVKTADGERDYREYLSEFVSENPEFLPARIAGGSGLQPGDKRSVSSSFDLDQIKPGMSAEEMQRVREHIAAIASQDLRGL